MRHTGGTQETPSSIQEHPAFSWVVWSVFLGSWSSKVHKNLGFYGFLGLYGAFSWALRFSWVLRSVFLGCVELESP